MGVAIIHYWVGFKWAIYVCESTYNLKSALQKCGFLLLSSPLLLLVSLFQGELFRGQIQGWRERDVEVKPSDHSLLGEGGKVQGFAWQWWPRAAESCHREFKGPPLFHFPPWTSACSNKNPLFVPVSFHCRSLTFIWIFVPVWGCWLLFLPHLTNEEKEMCDIKWFAQVTQKVGDGVRERKSQFLLSLLRASHQRKPCSVQNILIQPWPSLYGHVLDLLPAPIDC